MKDGERQQHEREPADAAVLGRLGGILGALAAIVACVYTVVQDGLPESAGGIALAAGFIVLPMVVLVVLVNHHRASEGKRPFIPSGVALFATTAIAFAVVAGIFAGLAGPTGGTSSAEGSNAYAKELRRELQRLRSASGPAYSAASGNREIYAEEAQDLGELYREVSDNLSVVLVRPRDRAAHLRLVQRLAEVGEAYEHLAAVAAERSAGEAAIEAARDRVRAAGNGVRAAEQGLERRGYEIVISSG